jgi:hypothetical protein
MNRRKLKTDYKEPETFDELLDALTEHGLDFERGEPLWKQLTARGVALISDLLERPEGDKPFKLVDLALQKLLETLDPDLRPEAAATLETYLARTSPSFRRNAAIKAFPHAFARDPRLQDRLLGIALDPTEDMAIRTTVCQTLAEMQPKGPQAERLLSLLEAGSEQWLEHVPLRDATFLCLRRHALKIPGKRLLHRLEPFLTHQNPIIRNCAIGLIATFGEVDVIEHLFALPDAQSHRKEILAAVKEIGERPINLLSLRPDAFESFVARLLKRMGFQDVAVTRYHDHGVDAVGYQSRQNFAGGEREKWIVQCKRYSNDTIDEPTIQNFAKTVVEHHAHQGLFITTSDYTKPAREFAAPRKNIELISGVQLIQRLESLFEANRYRILVHA